MNIIRLLSAIPQFLKDAQLLGTDVERIQANPLIVAELDKNSVLKKAAQLVAQEWRTVEEDAIAVHKSNVFTALPRLGRFLQHAKQLENQVVQYAHDPALEAALAESPNVSAALAAISAQVRAVEGDLS